MFDRLIQFINNISVTEQKPRDIFANIRGHDDLKQLLKTALHASAPVHILITGPPQTGKTEICKCIEEAYPSIWIDTYTTVAGLIQKLVDKPDVKVLIVNEIEKCRQDVRIALLEILENQRILKTTKTEEYDIHHDIWMIATSNNLEKLEKSEQPFLSRVIVKELFEYTPGVFLEIAVFRLQREAGITPSLALYIARKILELYGPDLRKAVLVARMAKTIEDIDRTVRLL